MGKNNECEDKKPTLIEVVKKTGEKSLRIESLPSPSKVRSPKNDVEAIKMIDLGQKLIELGIKYVGPKLSYDEKSILQTLSSSVVAKILSKRQVSISPPESESCAHHSPRQNQSTSTSSRNKRRPFNSRSPSPSYKRERFVKTFKLKSV